MDYVVVTVRLIPLGNPRLIKLGFAYNRDINFDILNSIHPNTGQEVDYYSWS